jgi:hypothetical protein
MALVPVPLREIFDENHPEFVELGREVDFFLTWENGEVIAVNERIPGTNKVLTIVDGMQERLGFMKDDSDVQA